jgi:glycerol-3-phosphate dehydrogenase
MARAYGSLLHKMLADVDSLADMGRDFGAGLTQIEVDWLQHQEWARSAEDILLRRTKFGLALNDSQQAELENYFRATT